ncbi:MAG: prephenate dehydrogenase/arogenate dehydrogenase family protein [Candidatus Viridilinea halotolerans]|uniref:Prephenate dehydrogenase/arogenate dehydrogenase family protein n=1 Tax=Candidatus Viridilinea halotolerans TaxID=2491704 RepID=A0A426U579_9CHLR|nr:MAG: prephenate dehydrogenase/arogenate dehydrogenase family protein [Candidatus Viridilinea halotolerans]
MIRISIIGLGLIGGSLGMALRAAEAKESALGPLEVTGWDRDSRVVKEAHGRLAIDHAAATLAECVRTAQIVVVATPVQAVRDVLHELAPLLPAGAVVTDVASTKAEVARWAAEMLPAGVAYVGGHPMAGKEHAGIEAATPDLFQQAIYCLTANPQTPQPALEAVEALVRTVGAKPYYIDPEEHDAYVAAISHLPMLLSVGLMAVTSSSPAWRELAPLAATGFRDVSRLASGDPQMHRDILLTNRVALTRWIDAMLGFLVEMRDQLAANDSASIEALLQRTKEQRDTWLASRPNLRPGEADFLQQPEPERPNLFSFRLPKRKG